MIPPRVEGEVAFIPLTKGYEAIIDAADVPLVLGRSWIAMPKSHGAVYVVSKEGSGRARRNLLLHRHLLQPPDDMTVDHLDWNPLNNRRSNLRIVTQAENGRRQQIPRVGFGTVVFVQSRARWQARANQEGKRIYLGMFTIREDAERALEDWRTRQEQAPVTA